jgi:transcriptional regulator with XRE-family HTH domain
MPTQSYRANGTLRDLRLEAKGWTQQKLAIEAGVSAQTVRKAEQGLAISEVSLARIAKALGTTFDRLVKTEA